MAAASAKVTIDFCIAVLITMLPPRFNR